MNDTLDLAVEVDREVPQGVGPVVPLPARSQTPLRRQIFDHVRAQGRASRADVARALGITDELELKAIEAAALLHDTGSWRCPSTSSTSRAS